MTRLVKWAQNPIQTEVQIQFKFCQELKRVSVILILTITKPRTVRPTIDAFREELNERETDNCIFIFNV